MPEEFQNGSNKNQLKSRTRRKQSTSKAEAKPSPSQHAAPGDKNNEEPAPNRGNNGHREPITNARKNQQGKKDLPSTMNEDMHAKLVARLCNPSGYQQSPGENTTDPQEDMLESKSTATGKEDLPAPNKKKSPKSQSATAPQNKRNPREKEMNATKQQRKDQQRPMSSDKAARPRKKKDSSAKADDLASGPQLKLPESTFATEERGDECNQIDGDPPEASLPQECSSNDTDRESARSTPKDVTDAPHPEKPKGAGSSRRGRKPTKTDIKGDKSKRDAVNIDTPPLQGHSDVISNEQEAQPANEAAINTGGGQGVASGEQCPQPTGTDMIDPPVPPTVKETPSQTTPTQDTNACNQETAADVPSQSSKEKETVQDEVLQDGETAKDSENGSRAVNDAISCLARTNLISEPKAVTPTKENPRLVKTVASFAVQKRTVSHKEKTGPEKHRPNTLEEIVGNKDLISSMKTWLKSWHRTLRNDGFRASRGEKSILHYRAVLISGPPGIGKTSAAHLLAKEANFEVLELNASDARSKGVLEKKISEVFDNRTLTDFYKRGEEKKKTKGMLLLMDEVDGMHGGSDRGGAATLAKMIQKTKIPVICICNNPWSKVVKPLKGVCFAAKFTRSNPRYMTPYLANIARREEIRLASQAIDDLVRGTKSDIRQILNLLTIFKLHNNCGPLGPQAARELIIKHAKDIRKSIFEIPSALLDNAYWRLSTLNTKCNVYFQNDTVAPMMIQENYVRYTPGKTPKGVSTEIGELQCIAEAAESIADGDILEAALHGPQHDYGLAQAHSMLSCVRPAYFMHGTNKMNSHAFPSHINHMRREAKSKRVLKDLRDVTMRAAAKKDSPLPLLSNRNDIRQDNVPALNALISHYFQDKSTHQKVLDIMEDCGLDKSHLDVLEHLTIGDKTIHGPRGAATTGTKMSFGKRYAPIAKKKNVKEITRHIYRNDTLELGDYDAIDWEVDDSDDDDQDDFWDGLADVDELQLFL